ncbi:MAG: DUF6580 family putative transport protein [Candidatus Saccharibacteria bacterium]
MTKNKTILTKILIATGLITVAVGWRIINHEFYFAPNLEFVTVAAVMAAIILGVRWAIVVPLLSMVISDLIIGNSAIFIFTWGAFAVIGAGAIMLKKLNNQPGKQIAASAGFAIVSSFAFFAITNFGVWAQGWYPATFAGLTQSYIMAIPFYRTMIIGNLIIVPAAVATYQLIRARAAAKSLVVNTTIS